MAAVTLQRDLLGQTLRPAVSAGTFVDNLSVPVHRWFRYPAGFSGVWAEHLIAGFSTPSPKVLDPFAGSGTTLIAAQWANAEAIGLETHPFVARVAKAKLQWTADPGALVRAAKRLVERTKPTQVATPAPLLARCFTPASLAKLDSLRREIDGFTTDPSVAPLLWLGLVAILRRCSPVGTAQWQYVLPRRRKAEVAEPIRAFRDQIALMAADMRTAQRAHRSLRATLLQEDARRAPSAPKEWADLVLTSPPYPNNFDYADATRLEMTFLGEIREWGDLQTEVRNHLLRSCSQHMGGTDVRPLLTSSLLAPIRDELSTAYQTLDRERARHGGRKAYHSMVVAYFHDLAESWREIRRVCRTGARVCFVIGDSAPYGVHLPVERWLGELAVGAGFRSYSFEKLRDRNLKWLNRKHRVPLKEGLLWVEG